MVDMVVHRHDMRATLSRLIGMLTMSPAPGLHDETADTGEAEDDKAVQLKRQAD